MALMVMEMGTAALVTVRGWGIVMLTAGVTTLVMVEATMGL
jgi:hypothetical protein